MLSPDSMTPSDPEAQIVINLMDGFRASKAVFTAVSLGVFDRLHESPANCETLSRELNCQPHALERILGACAGLQLLRVEQGIYHNESPATRFLRMQSQESLTGYILSSDRMLYRLWAHLESAVREGTNRWEREFGKKEGIFDHFFSTEADKKLFMAGMHGHGVLSSPAVVASFDLSSFHHLVDLGGGTGHLAIDACRRFPGLSGTIFDLPSVIPISREYVHLAGLESRIQFKNGDFFQDPLPPADLYSLGRILHDWSDEKVVFLLRKAFEHLPEKGGLLICEKLLNENRDGPANAYLQSLNMLVCTEGKERTASEYKTLATMAGFRSFQHRRTGQPVDAMLARK
ncbi:MAG: class I SAM-dependent methyltransferase [Terriglobia bacterium]